MTPTRRASEALVRLTRRASEESTLPARSAGDAMNRSHRAGSLALRVRRGKTLIEMLILVSMLSAILATTATTLVALFKTDRQIRGDLTQLTALARLSSRFRTDAHAATSCQIDQACALTLPDGRVVRYAQEGRRLHRQVLRGEAALHRDAFVLPDTALVKFEQPAEHGTRLVRLTIRSQADADKSFLTPVRPTTIDAAIGLTVVQQEPRP